MIEEESRAPYIVFICRCFKSCRDHIGENTVVEKKIIGENERTLVCCYQYFVEGLRSIILRTNVLLLRQRHQLLAYIC
jgi:hypothetical protein